MFLVNVVLARNQSKEDYGMFALSYSIFTFLAAIHNAAVLEPFTVYGSGRYRDKYSAYWGLMMSGNVLIGIVLSAGLFLTYLVFTKVAPMLNSRPLLGLAIALSFLLTGLFVRRSFYVIQQPTQAAGASLVYFLVVALELWIATKMRLLSGFSVFLILGLSWIVAGVGLVRELPAGGRPRAFLDSEPRYREEHWKYARWVLVTAFVFQFTHQGYYWFVGGLLSVKEVGELKAMYMLIAPIEQVMISLSFLFLPALAAKYASQNMGRFLGTWKRYTLLILAITLTFAFAVRVAGSRIVHILYSGKFDGLGPMLFILALVPLVMGIGNTAGDAIKAAEKPRLIFYAYVSSALATFAVGIPLVKFFGLRGAAWGMIVSAATYSLALLIAFRLRVYGPRLSPVPVAYTAAVDLPPLEGRL
jgi:O-antigen/teichoic acid export membrane protein